MILVIPASEMTLEEVERKFNLQPSEDQQFFSEWQENLPELSEEEKESLDQVKADFLGSSVLIMLNQQLTGREQGTGNREQGTGNRE